MIKQLLQRYNNNIITAINLQISLKIVLREILIDLNFVMLLLCMNPSTNGNQFSQLTLIHLFNYRYEAGFFEIMEREKNSLK